MRLINADYVEKLLSEKAESTTCELAKQTLNTFVLIIKSIPTIEAEPVKHGKWIQPDKEHEFNDLYRCSKCYYLGDWHDIGKKYCPSCGAKMDL